MRLMVELASKEINGINYKLNRDRQYNKIITTIIVITTAITTTTTIIIITIITK